MARWRAQEGPRRPLGGDLIVSKHEDAAEREGGACARWAGEMLLCRLQARKEPVDASIAKVGDEEGKRCGRTRAEHSPWVDSRPLHTQPGRRAAGHRPLLQVDRAVDDDGRVGQVARDDQRRGQVGDERRRLVAVNLLRVL